MTLHELAHRSLGRVDRLRTRACAPEPVAATSDIPGVIYPSASMASTIKARACFP